MLGVRVATVLFLATRHFKAAQIPQPVWGITDEKAKCYFQTLPGLFWPFITKYLYFLNTTPKRWGFSGYCQAII